jgi:two-component system, NarL family, sensor histidine kinase DesK
MTNTRMDALKHADMAPIRSNKRIWQYVILLNLAIPIYFMLQEPVDRLLPGMAALLVLGGLHIRMDFIAMKHKAAALLLQTLIILALGFLYHPMYVYLIFLTVSAMNPLRLAHHMALTALFASGLLGMMLVSGHAGDWQFWFNLFPPIFGGCILPYVIRISTRYRDMAERLQAATAQIERFAQQEERQRIASELHDTLGHTLSLIMLKSELTEKMIGRDPVKAANEASEIRVTAGTALKQMRELVTDMKAVRLDEEFQHARALCAAANVALAIDNRIEAEGKLTLTPLQESVIAMCMREALTNMVRHSHAAACRVTLEADAEAIRCTIADNGIGIQDDAASSVSGNGIAGIRQRLGLLEGRLDFASSAGGGLKLVMRVPIVRRQLRKDGENE